MNILKNFVNPWETNEAVLGTNVLQTSVLENNFSKKKEDFSHAKGLEVDFSGADSEKAFKAFFNTRLGKRFISFFAKRGQILYNYTFPKHGKYFLKGIDLKYYDGIVFNKNGSIRENNGGITEGGLNGDTIINNRLQLAVKINTAFQKKLLIDKVDTIVHESFLHVYEYTLDFIDNRKIDYSHDPFYKKITSSPQTSFHHLMFHHKKGVTQSHIFALWGLSVLESINKTYNLGYSRTYLWNNILWDFAD